MTHHKRKRPKKRRAGCLLCKPYKGPGIRKQAEPACVRRKLQRERDNSE